MGRILDLCGEVAATAEEGSDGLFLAPADMARLGSEWSEADIEDALSLVHESLLQGELVDAADSLSTRLLDVLGTLADPPIFEAAQSEGARLSLEVVGHLARRVARLEEMLAAFREGVRPDRHGFDLLLARLANLGIEAQMGSDPNPELLDDEE
jgi:hypothetical protein